MSNQVTITLTRAAGEATRGTYIQLAGYWQLANEGKLQADPPIANTLLCLPFVTFVATIADPGESLDPAGLDGPVVTELVNLNTGSAEAIPPYLPLSCLENWIRAQVGNETKVEINYGKSAKSPAAVN